MNSIPRLTNRADINANASEKLQQAKEHLKNAGLLKTPTTEFVAGDVHITTPVDTIIQSQSMLINLIKNRIQGQGEIGYDSGTP